MRITIFKFWGLMLLIFIALIIFSWKKKKEKISEKITYLIKSIWSNLHLILLIWLILFLYLELIFIIVKVKVNFLYVVTFSSFGVAITFLGAYISKDIILLIRTKIFSKKYGGRKLTHKEIVDISNKNETSLLLWNYILTFIVCGVLYSIINEVVFNKDNILEILLISLISTICYWFIFVKNYSK